MQGWERMSEGERMTRASASTGSKDVKVEVFLFISCFLYCRNII